MSALFEPREAVASDFDVVAFVFQLELQHAADRRVVFNDENTICVRRLVHTVALSAMRTLNSRREG